LEVLITNEVTTTSPETESVIRRAVSTTLQVEGVKQGEVSVLLTSDERIQSLNREWRGVDAPTDVLSFALNEADEPDLVLTADMPITLGDIIISLPRAQEQATEYNHSIQRELAFLAVHGTLHLLGYDHEKGGQEQQDMRMREEAILSGLGLTRQAID
jgi:probable rRNA maturation factor